MFEDDNLDDLDIGLEDLPSSRMGRSPFAFPWHYFHNLDIILQHSDIDVEIIGDICPTSEEDSCTWFLQALPVRDPVFMK